jgi:hypothetical protein
MNMQSNHRRVIQMDIFNWSTQAKLMLARAVQMQLTTGLKLEECLESQEAIRNQVGEFSLQGANNQLYQLILNHRRAGYTPRKAAFRALQDLYI